MPDIQVSIFSIVVAVMLGFFLSYLWYTPLFGKVWAKEMGFSSDEKPDSLMKSLLLTICSIFLITFVLSNNIAAWTPNTWGSSIPSLPLYAQALQAALFTWVGYFVSTGLLGIAWEKRSWKLFAIDAGYYLVLLLLIAFTIVYV